ncbi:ABC transporter permease [uncultured Kriegella sp.]|uniref:ABC transporter permease n=1 Tax=uncultured Kriegella sp. TaxID=1798910 RepID=UPI0030DAE18A|tara:strand:+ start:70256 stop:72739 length:2484 start_codon:yes stop_codon:yes gene_type:complete
MLKNHLKIALRFFLRNKLFTGINVLGLSIGITAFILLISYIAFEKSYDSFIPEVDNLYRVTLTTNLGGNGFATSATNHPMAGPAMLSDFPEVESYTRIADKPMGFSGTMNISYTNSNGDEIKSDANDDHIYFADNAIIDLFDIQFIQGDPATALEEPITVILAEKIAHRFFGNEDPIDKMIEINDNFKLKVTGVFKDRPENTHLPMGMIVSYNIFGQDGDHANSWVWPEFYNYVKLKPGTDPKVVEAKFPAFVKKYLGNIMNEHGFEAKLALQPVKDIHLKSHLLKEISPNNSEGTLYFLLIVAGFIIAIAMINFVNLSTAKSMERAKEVGLKKVVGAPRSVLIHQFLFESLIINFFAVIISFVLINLLIPSFNSLVGIEVLNFGMWGQWQVWLAMIGIFLLGGILAGLYPAFVLSGFVPIEVLRGKFHKTSKGNTLQKTLVVAQFAISIALIAGTYIVYNQFSYMQNQDLGFDAEQNLVFSAPMYADSTTQLKVESFKRELIQNPKINSVALSDEIPGKPIIQGNTIRQVHVRRELGVNANFVIVDQDFIKTYDIELLAGRDFVKEDATTLYTREGAVPSGHRVIINRSAAKNLGFSDPEAAIDQKMIFKYGPIDRTTEIIGVVEDHHQQSLQKGYDPIVFMHFADYTASFVTVNIAGNNIHETTAQIETKFKEFFPNDLYNFFFIDDYFNRQYKAESKFGIICLVFSVLAIFIAALGLFGLGSHMAMQKTKEISVRKVMGATVVQALAIIPRKLLGLVLLSGAIALPIIYFVTKNWLEKYAFKIDLSITMFLAPLLVVLVVAALSILSQSFKTAMVNPAESLRNE